MKEKVIVAGGAGFLGSNLCTHLIELGYEVLCIDNLLKGSLKNINHLKNSPKFNFLEYDITKKLPRNLAFDQIYHLASPASPNPNRPKNIHVIPFETMAANTIGTWGLCKTASKQKAKFLFASTSEIYGDPEIHPQSEKYNGNVSTTDPRSVYNEAKRFGETIVAAFVRSRNLDGKIIRIFNTYGPGMALEDGRVVIEFIVNALENKPLTIFGNGLSTRSFCYVSDLIKGIVAVMNQGEKGCIYNLGNPGEYTILKLAQKIKKLTGSKSKIIFQEIPPQEIGSPKRRCPDINKAKKELGWKPIIKLDQGLTEMIKFVKTQI